MSQLSSRFNRTNKPIHKNEQQFHSKGTGNLKRFSEEGVHELVTTSWAGAPREAQRGLSRQVQWDTGRGMEGQSILTRSASEVLRRKGKTGVWPLSWGICPKARLCPNCLEDSAFLSSRPQLNFTLPSILLLSTLWKTPVPCCLAVHTLKSTSPGDESP